MTKSSMWARVEFDRTVHEILEPHQSFGPSGTLNRTARGSPVALARGDFIRRSGGSRCDRSASRTPPSASPAASRFAFSSSGVQ